MKIRRVVFKENYANVQWFSEEIGFGEIEFYFDATGMLVIDSETMNKEFVKQVLEQVVDNARLREYKHPFNGKG
jgi:hypothetical protein